MDFFSYNHDNKSKNNMAVSIIDLYKRNKPNISMNGGVSLTETSNNPFLTNIDVYEHKEKHYKNNKIHPHHEFNSSPINSEPYYENSDINNNSSNSYNNTLMAELASRMNDEFDDLSNSDSDDDQDQDNRKKHKQTKKHKNKNKKSYSDKIPEFLHDPLVFLVIYLILSVPIIRDNIANYIPIIGKSDGSHGDMVDNLSFGILIVGVYVIYRKIMPKEKSSD